MELGHRSTESIRPVAHDLHADVILAGGSVAGLITALCIDPRSRVLIFDRRPFPPHKPCGELLVPEGRELLAALPLRLDGIVGPERVAMRLVDRDAGTAPLQVGFAYQLDRRNLLLELRRATSKNVTIMEGVRVIGIEVRGDGIVVTAATSAGEPVRATAPILVGADGYASLSRKALSMERAHRAQVVQRLFEAERDVQYADFVFDANLAPGYYLWAFPKPQRRLLVGCPVAASTAAFAWAAETYGLRTPALRAEGHPVTCIESIDEVVLGRGRVLLVGEAAGFVRPASGEGLTLAIRSAMTAAAAINENPEDPLPGYRRRCDPIIDQLAKECRYARALFDPQRRRDLYPRRTTS